VCFPIGSVSLSLGNNATSLFFVGRFGTVWRGRSN
jgi:hypothetical protein